MARGLRGHMRKYRAVFSVGALAVQGFLKPQALAYAPAKQHFRSLLSGGKRRGVQKLPGAKSVDTLHTGSLPQQLRAHLQQLGLLSPKILSQPGAACGTVVQQQQQHGQGLPWCRALHPLPYPLCHLWIKVFHTITPMLHPMKKQKKS